MGSPPARRLFGRDDGLVRDEEPATHLPVSIYADPALGMEQVDSFVAWRTAYAGTRVKPVAVKVFQDGVNEARTAAMLAPYLGHGDEAGVPIWPAQRLDFLIPRLVEQDFTVHVHAIGDRAIRMALDAFEHAARANGTTGRRHRIEHAEVPALEDLPRFAALGVIASTQAMFASLDSITLVNYVPALGPARASRSNAFKLFDKKIL